MIFNISIGIARPLVLQFLVSGKKNIYCETVLYEIEKKTMQTPHKIRISLKNGVKSAHHQTFGTQFETVSLQDPHYLRQHIILYEKE